MSNEGIVSLYRESTALGLRVAAQLKGENQTTFDNLSMQDLDKHIEKVGQEVFDRYVFTIYNLLIQNPNIEQASNFLSHINPANVPMFLSSKEFESVCSKLSRNSYGNHSLVEYYFKGTGKPLSLNNGIKSMRKIYINPNISELPAFVERLYQLLEQNGVAIDSSKVHFDGAGKDVDGNLISQGSNTLVIYLTDDAKLPGLIKSINETETTTGISLHKYHKDSLKRTFAIDDKMIVGVDSYFTNPPRSFDYWSSGIGWETYRKFRKIKTFSLNDVRDSMVGLLFDRTGKTPNQYFK